MKSCSSNEITNDFDLGINFSNYWTNSQGREVYNGDVILTDEITDELYDAITLLLNHRWYQFLESNSGLIVYTNASKTENAKLSYQRLGINKESEDLQKKWLDTFPKFLLMHPDDARARMFYATALAEDNKKDEAKKEAAKALQLSPDDAVMLYNVACVYARLNESKFAVEALGRSIDAGNEMYDWIKRDTDLDNIRKEPSYIELMKDK